MRLLFKKILKAIKEISPRDSLNDNGYEKVRGPLTYSQDGLASIHNCDCLKDNKFLRAYNAGKSTGSWGDLDIHWRAYIACWAANKAKYLEGDFVECGVNKGGLALAVMEYINFKGLSKTFYLLDTFCGLSGDYITAEEDKIGRKSGGYADCFEEVKKTFKGFKNVEIIRGTVPDTLSFVNVSKVSYLSLDINCAMPEIAAANFFWDKLVSSGVIVLDDYGWNACLPQKKAFDEFAAAKNVQILQLPTGQGLIFKP
jgi:hypothetical protein